MLSYANRKRRILVDSSEDEEENRGKENRQITINLTPQLRKTLAAKHTKGIMIHKLQLL